MTKYSIDSTIIKLKNNLSSDKLKEIYNSKDEKNEENEEKQISESESVLSVGQYRMKECIICAKHFKKNEKLGMLRCEHCFHINCIIIWFERKNECPICKKKTI